MLETLNSILVPGGRARLSPYVEDAQLSVLFGESPDPTRRCASVREIISRHEREIKELERHYVQFVKENRSFNSGRYDDVIFRKLYLAYYFPTNICKVQRCLIDMVHLGKLTGNIVLVDLGVGAGTTFVATLDFLMAWATACTLHGSDFPVRSLEMVGFDSNQSCLNLGRDVLDQFTHGIDRQISAVHNSGAMVTARASIVSWGRAAKWQSLDVNQSKLPRFNDQTILVAANVLSELEATGRENIASFLTNGHPGSMGIVIEPGDKNRCKRLNTWRSEFAGPERIVVPVLPCGSDARAQTQEICQRCWNARRESFHEPALYRMLRAGIATRMSDSRSFNEFTNNLLSWSYTILERREAARFVADTIPDGTVHSRYIGRIQQVGNVPVVQVASQDPDELEQKDAREWIKLCPAMVAAPNIRALWAKRHVGIQLPAWRHGETVRFPNTDLKQSANGVGSFLLNLKFDYETPSYSGEVASRTNFLDRYDESAREAVDEIAYRLFGFSGMRPFQHEILGRVLCGRNILGIASTGGGKSECFILPAMLFPGITIVISPLRSLMQDQYQQRIDLRFGLKNLSTVINGDIPMKERQARLHRMEMGWYKLVYFTPEQLQKDHVLNCLKRAHERVGIRYLALDEAHCISQWGHDFRDSYLNLVARLKENGINPVRIALTATASSEVRKDLCDELQLNKASLENGGDVYVHSSNRPELNLIVCAVSSTGEKVVDIETRLREFLADGDSTGTSQAAIVFMPHTGNQYPGQTSVTENSGRESTRASDFAGYLERTLGTRVSLYHSKMDPAGKPNTEAGPPLGDMSGRTRSLEQNRFMGGERKIMVATKGFGMGIDKPDIRLIIHRTPTANLEAYAQEAGRAGRDGGIANVVLYYSPDGGRGKSDHDIQSYFLEEKYIRSADVIAMNAFLRSVTRVSANRLYFTNDEVMHEFDKDTEYSWPVFEPRPTANQNESAEHRAFLDRGYLYRKKTKHIGRILSALYRISPDVPGRGRLCLIEAEQETGARLVPRNGIDPLVNAKAILSSNAYFGDLLRSRQVDLRKLKEHIQKCIEEDTLDFARFLGISVGEVASLLRDISKTDGKLVGSWQRWESDLLEFKEIVAPRYGCAAGKNSVSDWRAFAGAKSRAHGSIALKRMKEALKRGEDRKIKLDGSHMPNLDDWFSMSELPKSVGWEVARGEVLLNPHLFRDYHAAFMELHDKRKANDQASYRLLLTDYIGANGDGSLSVQNGTKQCLRAVMLGYLKSGEVVTGNCGGCSHCCPDERFEMDMKKRELAVARLGVTIIEYLDSLENMTDKIPTESQLSTLWNIVAEHESSGRSLIAYLSGWTGRLLTDSPGHKAALWIRLTATAKKLFQMHTEEVSENTLQVVSTATADEFNAVLSLLEIVGEMLPRHISIFLAKAKLYRRMKYYRDEADQWVAILSMPDGVHLFHQAHVALCELYGADMPMCDSHLCERHALSAARSAVDIHEKIEFYELSRPHWLWADIREEIRMHVSRQPDAADNSRALCEWWIEFHSSIPHLESEIARDDWRAVFDATLSSITCELSISEPTERLLADVILQWARKSIHLDPDMNTVRAFMISIIAGGYSSSDISLNDECVRFMRSATEEQMIWLGEIVDRGVLNPDHPETRRVLAETIAIRAVVAQRKFMPEEAKSLWIRLADQYFDRSHRYLAHSSLLHLSAPSGTLSDAAQFHEHAIAAARTAPNFGESVSHYSQARDQWPWDDFRIELLFHLHDDNRGTSTATSLCEWWIGSQSKIAELAASSPPGDWKAIIKEALNWVLEESTESTNLGEIVSGALEIWSGSTSSLAVAALRILLAVNFNVSGKIDCRAECSSIIADADDEMMHWLINRIDRLNADRPAIRQVLADLVAARADIAMQEKRNEDARDLWLRLAGMQCGRKLVHKAHASLSSIFRSDGPLPESDASFHHAVLAGRTADTSSVTISFYALAQSRWSWVEMRSEIIFHMGRNVFGSEIPDRLCEWWVSSASSVAELGATPPPADWDAIIEETLILSSERVETSIPLRKMILKALGGWSAGSSGATIYALRIVLGAVGRMDKGFDFQAEGEAFINVADDELLARFVILVEGLHINLTEMRELLAQVLSARAKHAMRLDRHLDARDLWLHVTEIPCSQQVSRAAHDALQKIFSSDGPFPDKVACSQHALLAIPIGEGQDFWRWIFNMLSEKRQEFGVTRKSTPEGRVLFDTRALILIARQFNKRTEFCERVTTVNPEFPREVWVRFDDDEMEEDFSLITAVSRFRKTELCPNHGHLFWKCDCPLPVLDSFPNLVPE